MRFCFLTTAPGMLPLAGKPNPQQPELIRAAVARMPADSEIVSAMDADAEGGKLAEVVRQAVELSGRHDLRFTLARAFRP